MQRSSENSSRLLRTLDCLKGAFTEPLSWVNRIFAAFLALWVRFYQLAVSPLLPGACRFEPTCSNYALEALQRHAALKGSLLVAARLLRCRPGAAWGYDPVPAPCAHRAGSMRPEKRHGLLASTLFFGAIFGAALCLIPAKASADPNSETFPTVTIKTDQARYLFSSFHGAMKSAVLLKEQFRQRGKAVEQGIPSERFKDGPLDLVTTWDSLFLPLQIHFTQLNPDPEVQRVVRTGVPVTFFGSTPAQMGVKLGKSPNPSDEAIPLLPGDLLRAADGKTLGSVQGNGAGGVHEFVATPGSIVAAGDRVVDVLRVGPFSAVFSSDPRFRVVESPEGTARFVWPDARRDKSPLTIERIYRKKADYEIESILRFYWEGAKPLKHREDLVLYGWAGEHMEEPSMLNPAPNMIQPACGIGDSTEHADRDQADPTYHGSADWAGIEFRYFLLGAALDSGTSKPNCVLQIGPLSLLTATLAPNMDNFLPLGKNMCRPKGAPEGSCDGLLESLGLDAFATPQEITRAPGTIALADRKKLVETFARDIRATIFAGPKDMKALEAAGHQFDAALDFGILSVLCKPLLWLLQFFYGMVPNWSIAIALLTITVKILLLYWTIKGFVSMREMQRLGPQTQAIKEKYKDKNPESQKKMQQEIFALYKKKGVNPMGGCLPMFIQMPVYIALYRTVSAAPDLYQAPLFLWIQDLAAPDPYFAMPVVLGVVMFIQQKLAPAGNMDPTQRKIMLWMMPIMFTGFMLGLPSGLVYYILINSILSIFQQVYIYRKKDAMDSTPQPVTSS